VQPNPTPIFVPVPEPAAGAFTLLDQHLPSNLGLALACAVPEQDAGDLAVGVVEEACSSSRVNARLIGSPSAPNSTAACSPHRDPADTRLLTKPNRPITPRLTFQRGHTAHPHGAAGR
jgi:hypothetical protein